VEVEELVLVACLEVLEVEAEVLVEQLQQVELAQQTKDELVELLLEQ
jgi:hypothetical protein